MPSSRCFLFKVKRFWEGGIFLFQTLNKRKTEKISMKKGVCPFYADKFHSLFALSLFILSCALFRFTSFISLFEFVLIGSRCAMAYSVESKSFHVYLSSDGCLDKFPDNLPNNFKIVLKKPKELNNKKRSWKVALARLGYDSAALYNLGGNTGTSFSVYLKGTYISIEMKESVFVSTI